MLKTIILASPECARHIATGLLDCSQLVAAISQPPKPVGRKNILTETPFSAWAKSHLPCPVLEPIRVSEESFLTELQTRFAPDIAITASFGQMLSQRFLDFFPYGVLNIHPSALPKWRGASPIQSALLAGETEIGIVIQKTVLKMDAGPIVAETSMAVRPEMTMPHVLDAAFQKAATLIPNTLKHLEEDPQFKLRDQDSALASYCKKIKKEDGQIQWELPAEQIHNQFRAFEHWPQVYTHFAGKRLLLKKMRPSATKSDWSPGTWGANQKRCCVACGDGRLMELSQVQEAGKKPMDAWAWLNKHVQDADQRSQLKQGAALAIGQFDYV